MLGGLEKKLVEDWDWNSEEYEYTKYFHLKEW